MNIKNISEYLYGYASDEKLLLVSFFITNSMALVQLKKEWAEKKANPGRVVKSAVDPSDFGGSIALADPYKLEQGFIAEIPLPFAFGLCFNEKNRSLYVASSNTVRQIKGGYCLKLLNNNLFNDLHSLGITLSGNLLVVATGTDSVLEVDFENSRQVIWEWLATEHGYNTDQSGQRRVTDRHTNCQLVATPTSEQTTHINTAIDWSDKILATLFHQGQLIEIDKKSKERKIVLSGLKSPHNIRKTKKGFILSDSRANRVLLLNSNFQIEKEIKRDFDWVQDAWEFQEGETYILGDSNNDRLVSVDISGKLISALHWAKSSKKISAIEFIDASQARDIFCPAF